MTINELLDMELDELIAQPPSTLKAEALAMYGLHYDGADHKQWFLEQILDALGWDLACVVLEHGDWDEGVAP